MKTPEEIKKGLVEAIEDASCVVEYGDAHDLIDDVEKNHAIMADALAFIQRLEETVSEKENIVGIVAAVAVAALLFGIILPLATNNGWYLLLVIVPVLCTGFITGVNE